MTNVARTSGFNHVAILTNDTDRLHRFYEQVFGATTSEIEQQPGFRLSFIHVGPQSELNVFEIAENTEAERQTPMFGRGRIDHLALQSASMEDFEAIRDALTERGHTDGFVTDFGPMLSLFFRDPDGLECEVCVPNPEAVPGVMNPPGTPAARFPGPQ